jgi:hypothetical protein
MFFSLSVLGQLRLDLDLDYRLGPYLSTDSKNDPLYRNTLASPIEYMKA